MADISAPGLTLAPPIPVMTAAEMAKRGKIADTARDFESSFL